MDFCKKCGNRLNINKDSLSACIVCQTTEPLTDRILMERSYVENEDHKNNMALFDKTYPMEDIKCPKCTHHPVIFRRTKELKKIYICENCNAKWDSV